MSEQTVIAVDFGRSKIATALVDSKLEIHDQRRHDVSGTNGFSELVELIIEHTSAMAQDHPEATALGISFAGHVDARRGLVYGRDIVKGDRPHVGRGRQRQVELAALLSEQTGRPAAIENDGTAATLAEWRAGTASGYNDVVCFTVGTHIGSGLVAGGQLIHRRTSGPLLGAIVSQDSNGELVIVGDRCSGSGVALLAQSHGLPADARQVAKI